MDRESVPEDFPQGRWSGSVAGAQPKLLGCRIGGRYVVGMTDDERLERYEACADLARQLKAYATRKMVGNPAWSLETTLARVEAGVAQKVLSGTWNLSAAEIAWIMAQVCRDLKTQATDPDSSRPAATMPAMDWRRPTILLGYDGTLHRGFATFDEVGTPGFTHGQTPFEYAYLLITMLAPYPDVQLVLSTSWLERMSVGTAVSYLPAGLAVRVVDTVMHVKLLHAGLSEQAVKTDAIRSYAYDNLILNWIALDAEADAQCLEGHRVVVPDPAKGIGDESVQHRIRTWLMEVHADTGPEHRE